MLGLSFSRLIYIHYSIKLFRWIRIHTFSVASSFKKKPVTCTLQNKQDFSAIPAYSINLTRISGTKNLISYQTCFQELKQNLQSKFKMAALGVVRQLRDLAADPQNRRKIVHDQGCLPGLVLLLDHNEEEVVSTALEVRESVLFTEPYSSFST